MKRHSEIGKYAVNGVMAVEAHEIAQKAEIAIDHCKPRVCHGAADGVFVLVESVEMALRTKMFHDGAAMSSAAVGGVDINTVGAQVKRFDAFGQQGRYVIDGFFHKTDRKISP